MILLIVSGLAIHYPDRFGILGSLAHAITWHTWLAALLILNAFLGAFYHLTAEKYHHFLPRMDDFTGAAVRQARFYLYGIFKGERHPLETDPRRKLNPLQKITYLALLNILLPYQIVTRRTHVGCRPLAAPLRQSRRPLDTGARAHAGCISFPGVPDRPYLSGDHGSDPVGPLRAMTAGRADNAAKSDPACPSVSLTDNKSPLSVIKCS